MTSVSVMKGDNFFMVGCSHRLQTQTAVFTSNHGYMPKQTAVATEGGVLAELDKKKIDV